MFRKLPCKLNLKTVLSLIFIVYFLSFVDSVSSFDVPHAFTILEETNSHILIQYQIQKIPSPSEIQSDINDIKSYQLSAISYQPTTNIANRTLVGIPENVEPSIEVLKTDWEEVNLNADLRLQNAEGKIKYSEYICKNTELVTVSPGYLRHQRIAIVEVHPLKCEASNFYFAKNIVFKIVLKPSYQPSAVSGQKTEDSAQKSEVRSQKSETGYYYETEEPFEQILKNSILNYKSLNRNKIDTHHSSLITQNSTNSLSTQHSLLSTEINPIKIIVKEPGIYSVTYDDVKAAGWDPDSIDPTKLQLQNKGRDIPILFYGEEDHLFDAGDYFVFYGEPWEDTLTHPYYTDNKSSFTIDNLYWLSIANTAATRIERVTQAPVAGAFFIEDFKHTGHFEINNSFASEEILRYYWEKFPDDKDATRTDPAAKDINITLHDINTQKEGMLRIKFFGASDIPDTENDHHAKFILNDAVANDAWLTNFRFYIHSENINGGILKEGDNTITIKNIFEPGSENIFCLAWIEVEYSRFFKVIDNELLFTDKSTAPHNIKIGGFQSNAVLLFDITTPQHVTKIEGVTVSEVSGNYSAVFGLQSNAERNFLILSSDKIKKPASILVDEPTELKSPSNQADYIIITHEDYYEEIQRLSKHRQDEGYKVKVVKVQDVYDEFNYGLMHPQAIKDFLTYTFNNWSAPAPTFVLLVGDGCSDATDKFNRGTINYIPIKLWFFKDRYTANDNWYVQLKGDDILPEMIIGRLPVKTSDQLKYIIDKIITYEKDVKNPWMRNVQFIAGQDIYGRNDDELFSSMNRDVAQKALPINYSPYFLTSEDYDKNDDPGKTIVDNINSGRAITVYYGHSSIMDWTQLFTNTQFSGLGNYQKPTFLISLDCSNGNFANPMTEGFAEEFLRIPGGGLACFAPTATVYTSEHEAIISNILSELFNKQNDTLGPACNQAKITSYLNGQLSKESFQEYNFLGDPATKFKICEFSLKSPADTTSVSGNAQFTWVADGYNRFKIQFSPYPDFSNFPVLSYLTTEPSFTPNVFVTARLNLMAKNHGTIYWRVGGMKSREEYSSNNLNAWINDIITPVFYCRPWSFTIQK